MRIRSFGVLHCIVLFAPTLAACGASTGAVERPASLFPPSGPVESATAQGLCPMAGVTMGEGKLRVTLGGDVLFDTDKSDLKATAVEALARVKTTVIDTHPGASIVVEGHTDDRASDEHNKGLSERRAASVATWLQSNGVAADRIEEKGYGEQYPRVPNDSAANRALNRRVELVLRWGPGAAGTAARSCPGVEACCQLTAMTGQPAAACIGKEPGRSGWGTDLGSRGLEDSEGVLHLNPCTTTRSAAVWITSTGENMIARLNESDGKQAFRVPTYGRFPQRTAVAADGSVWVTNRDSGSYVHISGDGKILCSSPESTCVTRAAAVDNRGFGWIGCNNNSTLIQVSPTETDGTVQLEQAGGTQTFPKCKEVGRVSVPGVAPYGLAADRNGGIWVGVSGGGRIAKVDATQRTVLLSLNPKDDPALKESGGCWSPYGISIDRDGNPWFANMHCGNVIKVDGRTGRVIGAFKGGPDGLKSPRALGFDREGNAWVAENGSVFVSQIASDGRFLRRVDISSCGNRRAPLGTAADSQGNMWTAIQDAGKVVKYSTDGKILGCYPEPPTPAFKNAYTYSDFTGAAMEMSGSDRGVSRVRFEHAQPVQWRLASFTALTPPGTGLCVRARSATSAAALDAAPWSQAACPTQATRSIVSVTLDGTRGAIRTPPGAVLEVELALTSSDLGASPLVSGLSVAATAR